jgi:cation diffusion facilitator CzcD-associated flavoprotein CzcO
VVIIGAGISGLGLGMALKRAGHQQFTIVEKADAVGGVWRDNTYPGAACDVPAHLYAYAREPHTWSGRYAGQPEILAYLRRCADKYRLDAHLRLGTEIVRADFAEPDGRWLLHTAAGETIEADVLVPACGQLSRPRHPDIPGAEEFTGSAFHSARWPHDHDLTGRSVAVIGTGASAIQIVPHIARQAARLTVFQRSAPYVVPRWDRVYPRRSGLAGRLSAKAARWGWWLFNEVSVPGLTRRWPVSRLTSYGCAAQLAQQVDDPEVRERLRPKDEPGCKRIGISSDYYPAFNAPHVELVTEPIARITDSGVRTENGREHRVDTIIYATGFSATDFVGPLTITGRDGRTLQDAWRHGAHAYLGMAVPAFPDMFLLYGPHTNIGAGSVTYMVESQIRYIVDAVRILASGQRRHLEVLPRPARVFAAEMRHRTRRTVWATCHNWYRGGQGQVTTNWPGQTAEYRRRTRRVDLGHYRPSPAGLPSPARPSPQATPRLPVPRRAR